MFIWFYTFVTIYFKVVLQFGAIWKKKNVRTISFEVYNILPKNMQQTWNIEKKFSKKKIFFFSVPKRGLR